MWHLRCASAYESPRYRSVALIASHFSVPQSRGCLIAVEIGDRVRFGAAHIVACVMCVCACVGVAPGPERDSGYRFRTARGDDRATYKVYMRSCTVLQIPVALHSL